MIELKNKRVLVVGLARTGRAVAARLRKEGAQVTVTDIRPPSFFGGTLKELMQARIGFELGAHREETFLNQDLIVVSPGVPWSLPQLDLARRRRIPVAPEVEAASWFFKGTLVGVTGTNGKTTTTTLLGKMLDGSGFQTFVAGNIGVPLISGVDLFSSESIVVAELSSFQLEAIREFRPHVAVLLNITANHLDRHGTFDAYVSAKAQIFRNQQPQDFAVLNADDPVVMSLAPVIASKKVFFSLEQDLPEGVLIQEGSMVYRVGHLERTLIDLREIKLRGEFNVQNVMAAAATACILGADFNAIRKVAKEFTGVEHRLEFVTTVRGVSFYNDSKATSVDAAAKALSTFDHGVHLILGGKDKGAPYTPLRPLLEGRVKCIYVIGSAQDLIAKDLAGAHIERCGELARAVKTAFAGAAPGDVVLFSPACASYDQFTDFEERGRAFKQLVGELPTTELPSAREAVPQPPSIPVEPARKPPAAALAGFKAQPDTQAHEAPRLMYEFDADEAPRELEWPIEEQKQEPASGPLPAEEEAEGPALPFELTSSSKAGSETDRASERPSYEPEVGETGREEPPRRQS
jgi:UDP-N-acetylmuramoylalanine--D-glutamate ligase